MEKSVSFKPIVWRLVIWRWVPIYLGFIIGMAIISLKKGYLDFPLFAAAIASLSVIVIYSVIFRKEFDIVISESHISGQGQGPFMGRETFPIADVDQALLHKHTLYEKIFLFSTIHSTTKKRILVSDFVYGKSAMSGLYAVLQEKNLAVQKDNFEKT